MQIPAAAYPPTVRRVRIAWVHFSATGKPTPASQTINEPLSQCSALRENSQLLNRSAELTAHDPELVFLRS